jgi:hypothetical protein
MNRAASMRQMSRRRIRRVSFQAISAAALVHLPALVRRWLPDGRLQGHEWVSRNPTRDDRKPGSFKINLRSGRWADFATGAKGGDVISLAAHLFGLSQVAAARKLAAMLGISAEDRQ